MKDTGGLERRDLGPPASPPMIGGGCAFELKLTSVLLEFSDFFEREYNTFNESSYVNGQAIIFKASGFTSSRPICLRPKYQENNGLVETQGDAPLDYPMSLQISVAHSRRPQPHWTNSLTGIKLTPVEALESGREPAQEIKMSLSSQRQPASAGKARESREAADISKELQLQIDAEAEKHRASNLLTKSLKEQFKVAKGTSGSGRGGNSVDTSLILSANFSGCVKTARKTNSSAHTMPDSAFDFWNGIDFSSLLTSLEGGSTSTSFIEHHVPSSEFLPYNPSFNAEFMRFTDEFNALIPSNFGAHAADPVDDLMSFYGISMSDFSGATDSAADSGFTSVATDETWPLLPPPPPESPPVASPAVERSSNPGTGAPRSRRSRQEVDEANIMHSTHSRAPTAWKRFADEDVSNRPQKNGERASKVFFSVLFLSSF
ncbi:hypothetical protein B0H14DRAFT_2606521 [Mycena olivaceomarginata]|nr:hypothetical protein B0H14DRAFT_2606521 [Mycena olivaceomarginata]